MSDEDVPSAYARSPMRPSPRGANTIRKLLAAAIILGAAFACWRMLAKWSRVDHSKELADARREGTATALCSYAEIYDGADDVEDDLARLHAAAKAKLASAPKPHGLDRILDTLRGETTNAIAFDAGTFTNAGFDAEWSAHFGGAGCADGFDDAFAEVLGSDVVKFDILKLHPETLRLAVSGKITPSGHGYQLPHSDKVFPGIALSADIALGATKLHVDVAPAVNVTFNRVVIGYAIAGPDDGDVTMGLVQGACKQAGLKLIEAMTGVAPPGPKIPTSADKIAECEKGFRCHEAADEVAKTDPDGAAKLYEQACRDNDDDACVAGADLLMARSKGIDEAAARAHMMVEMACMNGLAKSCAETGRFKLRPLEPGTAVGEERAGEALPYLLRGCDLGDRQACAEVVPMLAKTPFAAGVAAVARRSCESEACPLAKQPVVKTLLGAPLGGDRVFDVRWGQWRKLDSGEVTAWVASTSDAPPYIVDHQVRSFSPADVPKGIVPPPGATRIYAVTASAPARGENGCYQCMPSGGTGVYRSMDCVCAIAPR